MNLFVTQIDERTKKVILVLCALFIILLLISGGIYILIEKFMKKESKKMDTYMYPLIKNKIVNNNKQFIKALIYHESRLFFTEAKWGFRTGFIFTGLALLIVLICFKSHFGEFFTKAFELIPIFKWQTVGEINESLIDSGITTLLSGPSWLPASIFPTIISKNPDFTNPMLYCSLVYYSLILFSIYILIKSVIAFIARFTRGIKMSKTAFERNLDNIDLDAIDAYNEAINSKLPTTKENK